MFASRRLVRPNVCTRPTRSMISNDQFVRQNMCDVLAWEAVQADKALHKYVISGNASDEFLCELAHISAFYRRPLPANYMTTAKIRMYQLYDRTEKHEEKAFLISMMVYFELLSYS